MVARIIKEAIIALLICLLTMLLFAVVLYEFIPSRKVIPEVAEYKASEKVAEQLADNVDQDNEKVVLTYEVTGSDLNNYKITDDYVPGKANPFSDLSENPEINATPANNNTPNGSTTTNTTGDENKTSGNTTSDSTKEEPVTIK